MNILITGAWTKAKDHIPALEASGHSCKFMQYQDSELPCEHSWPEVIICSTFFNYYEIEKFTNLKVVQCVMAGTEHLPLDYINTNGIKLYNAKGVYSIPIAEFAISGILQIYKQSKFFANNQANHVWEKSRNLDELAGKTAYILGTGSIGSEIAKRLRAFDCKIIGFSKHANLNDCFDEVYTIDKFQNMAKSADIIISALPLNEETKHLINKEVFLNLNENSVLVNVSRGAIIDTVALEKQIKKIKGAVLDVFEDEPLPENSPLWDIPNVIITPHNSFNSTQNNTRLNKLIMKNLNTALCEIST